MDYMLFASVIKSFLTEELHKKNHEICHKLKKNLFLVKDKDLGLDEHFLTTP